MNGSQSTQSKEFLIIGAGLPRTGTLSLMRALEIILPGKCHHGMKAYKHENEWCNILNGKMSDEEFKQFLLSNDYTAGVDIPFILAYERAMKIFPNAKVLLTLRDPDSWVKSFENTLKLFMNPFTPLPYFLYLDLFRGYLAKHPLYDSFEGFTGKLMKLVGERSFTFVEMLEKGVGRQFYMDYVNEVRSKVPKERLIEFSVKDGWEPLCKELHLPCPDIPFPYLNSTDEFSGVIRMYIRRSWLVLYEIITIPLLSYGIYRLTQK